MPTRGTLFTVLIVGLTILGAVITDGTIRGDGIALTIGIIVVTTLGGVGTDITTLSITLCGIRTMAVIITIITPHALSIVVLRLAIAVTDPAQNEAHVRRQTAVLDRTTRTHQLTVATLQQTATPYLPIAIRADLPQRFHPAEPSVHSV